MGTVNKIRKEVSAVVKYRKEPLHSATLYKPGDATMTVYQGKAKKNVVIFSTLHQSITVTGKGLKAYIDKNMLLILSIKWQGNTQLELAPEDDLSATFVP